MEQVPLHPQDRLKKKTRIKTNPSTQQNERQALEIAAENEETLLKGKFNFSSQKILNKTILFDASLINEEGVGDKILEALPADNDKLHVLHEPGTKEDGK